MREGSPRSVAGYAEVWEADVAAAYLEERGIPAWVDQAGLDNPYRATAGALRLIRVFVPDERVEEARAALVEMRRELELPAEERPAVHATEPPPRRPPLWVSMVGLLLAAALAFAAVPPQFRVLVGLVAAYLLWRLRSPSQG